MSRRRSTRPKFGEARGWYEKDPNTGMGGPKANPTKPDYLGDYVAPVPSYVQASTGRTTPTRAETARQRSAAPSGLSTAGSFLLEELNDLLTPGPNARDIAKAAINLGVKPAIEEISQVPADLQKGVVGLVNLPEKRVDSFLGRETKGTPTIREILKAATRGPAVPAGQSKDAGTAVISSQPKGNPRGRLTINQKGELVTPRVRKAARDLTEAQRRVAESGAPVGQLAQQFPELSPRWLKALGAAQKRTGTPAALLAGIISQESDFGRSTLPGVHSGSNFAGAAGPFQIGNGTGAAGNAWDQVAEELWGDKAGQRSIYDPEDAAMGAGQYLQTFPSTPATKDPGTWRDAAFSYNHADWYADDVVREAQARKALNKLGSPPDPAAIQQLRVAKANAREVGLNPTAYNGDVAGGGPNFVTVRADAKGMVDWVESAVGTQEGTAKQQRWASKTGLGFTEPWCANFVSNGLTRRGITSLPVNPNYVPSYEEWGAKYAVGGGLAKAKPGDLLTFSGRHIGVYVGNGEMVSGNSSDAVSRTGIDSDLSMVIRPPYKGGKVKVAESQIVGSTMESALGSGTSGSFGGPGVAAASSGGGTREEAVQRAPLSLGNVPISDLLAVAAAMPGDFNRFQGGGEEAEEDTMAQILARGRRF